MDSDYVPSNDSSSDINSVTSSIASIKFLDIFPDLSEDDIHEITENILEQIDSYMKTEIIQISSPNFYTNMVEIISDCVLEDWISLDLCEEEDYEELLEEINDFVEQLLEYYLEFASTPRRAKAYSIDIQENENSDFITKQIQYLQSIPQPAQKTKEWYDFRNGLISASNLWKVFGTESQRNSLILEKCQPVNTNNYSRLGTDNAMHWGNKYEPVTVMVYENMFGTKVGEFGCIRHPKYPFIGASPDGINIEPSNQRYGRMLEIKNIVNRDITGIPKEEYWIQTQAQMEVCGLDQCDFMETRFLEYPNAETFYEDVEREYRGVILHFIERDLKAGSMPIYKYMPVDVSLDKETIDEFVASMREECRKEGLVLFNTLYWYLKEYSCVLIERNRQWFLSAVPKIEELWRIIEKERVDGYEHRAVKKKVVVSLNSDLSNSYIINNMPPQNSICLVKLD
jgi:putative phage-type endonuclease